MKLLGSELTDLCCAAKSLLSAREGHQPALLGFLCRLARKHDCSTGLRLIAVVLLLSGALAAAAQEVPEERFAESIEVRVVEVEVSVRTKNGDPVRNLTRSDFQLIVDGLPVPIEHFLEYAPGEGTTPGVPGHGFAPSQSAEVAETSPSVNVLIYIDEEFSLEIDLERVLAALERQLVALEARDRVAIVAWDGHRLEKLLDWTAPGEVVRSTLASARERRAWGLRTRLDDPGWGANLITGTENLRRRAGLEDGFVRPICSESGVDGLEPCAPSERAMERVRTLEVEHRIDRTARAAAAAVRSFPPQPGRRILALLSGGWASDQRNKFGMLGAWDPLLDVVDQLAYSIYAVDVPGMSAIFLADVENDGLSGSSGGAGFSALPQPIPNIEGPIHYTLRYLAERTGGEALINWERRHVFRRISEEARSYYSLGFSVDRKYDDQIHSIQVGIRLPGLEVQNRRSFRDLSPTTELDYALEAELLGASPAEPSAPLTARLGSIERSGFWRISVPLRISIPTEEWAVSDEPAADRERILELRIGAVDGEGRRVLIGPIPLAAPGREPGGRPLDVVIPLKLRRMSHELAVSLHDPSNGSLRTARLRVDVDASRTAR